MFGKRLPHHSWACQELLLKSIFKKNAATCVIFVQFLNTHRRHVEETNSYVIFGIQILISYLDIDILEFDELSPVILRFNYYHC